MFSFKISSYFSKIRSWQWIFFAIIALINLVIYFPSFWHIARSDQIVYLANSAQTNSWFSLITDFYSYSRSDYPYYTGELMSFRPLFFFILGTERWFFGYHFMLWHIAGLLFHLIFLWQLLALLYRIRPGFFAAAWTLFFSVMFANIEMVIWENVSIYMIFLACIVFCLRQAYEICLKQKITHRQIIGLTVALLIASFLYELGFIFSLLFFFFLCVMRYPVVPRHVPQKNTLRLLILLPFILYIAFNLLDWQARHLAPTAGSYLFKGTSLFQTLQNTFLSVYWWTVSALFPMFLAVLVVQRTIFFGSYAYDALIMRDLSFFITPDSFVALGAAGMYLWILFRNFSKRFPKKRIPFLALTALLGAVQAGVLIIGRVNPKGFSVLGNNTYFNYLVWAYFFIFLFAVIDFDRQQKFQNRHVIKTLSLVLLGILILINACWVFRYNLIRAECESQSRVILQRIENLVHEHRHEKDFSFYVPRMDRTDFPWLPISKPRDKSEISDIELLYPRFFNTTHPKYFISLSNRERMLFSLPRIKEFIRLHPLDLQAWGSLKETYAVLGDKKKETEVETCILEVISFIQEQSSGNQKNPTRKRRWFKESDIFKHFRIP